MPQLETNFTIDDIQLDIRDYQKKYHTQKRPTRPEGFKDFRNVFSSSRRTRALPRTQSRKSYKNRSVRVKKSTGRKSRHSKNSMSRNHSKNSNTSQNSRTRKTSRSIRRALERKHRSKKRFSHFTNDSRNSSKQSKGYSVNKSVNSWKRDLNISVNQDSKNRTYGFLQNYQTIQNS